MRNVLSRSLIVLLLVLVVACAAQQTTPPSQSPTVDVTGSWQGSRTVAQAGTTAFSLTLQQTGEKVTGTAAWPRSVSGLGGTGGPLTGSVSGNTFSFTIPSENFRGEVVVTGNEMSGTLDGPFSYRITASRQR